MSHLCANRACVTEVACPDKPWCSDACRRVVAHEAMLATHSAQEEDDTPFPPWHVAVNLALHAAAHQPPTPPVLVFSPAALAHLNERATAVSLPPVTSTAHVVVTQDQAPRLFRRILDAFGRGRTR
jgi:hypothetical protein